MLSIKTSTDKTLITLIYAYLALPILIFIFGWFKLYIALPCAIIIVIGVLYSIRDGFMYVENKALPAWLVTYLILNQKNIKSILPTALLLIPYGPLPFIGAILLVAYAVLFGMDNFNVRQMQNKVF